MSQLIAKASDYITNLLSSKLPETCLYHNLKHTQRVLKSTKEIIDNSGLSEEEGIILQLAALFHDVGYIDGYENHETKSALIASEFLKNEGLEESFIDDVGLCIEATRMENVPKTLLEKIIRDADASHFSKKYFQEASEQLRQELKLQGRENYSKTEWLAINIKFLSEQHTYCTDYALQNWSPKKRRKH